MFGLLRGRFLTYNLIKFCQCVFISRIALNTGRSAVKRHFNFVFNFMEDASKTWSGVVKCFTPDGLFYQAVPNSTKCATWQDIKASHMIKNPKIVLQLEDVFGMMIRLFIGINSAVLAFIAENFSSSKRVLGLISLTRSRSP